MEPWDKSLNFLFPTKHAIPKKKQAVLAIGQVRIDQDMTQDLMITSPGRSEFSN